MHRFSSGLPEAVARADCVIVACGKPGLVKGEWVTAASFLREEGGNWSAGR